MNNHTSWGQIPRITQTCLQFNWRNQPLPDNTPLLPYGQGRSYGDVCLIKDGYSLGTAGLNRFIDFNPENGVLRAEAGTTLANILEQVLPHSWFLPVTPGTKYVSLGGAVANDVHGKNHHREGTFGCHVLSLELLRSNGERLLCSPDENPQWFAATIGGLGLTGLITWVELQLKKISNPSIDQQNYRFANLEEFLRLSEQSENNWEYTVAWVDCMATGKQLGRGIFSVGKHAEENPHHSRSEVYKSTLSMPCRAPNWLLNQFSIKAFNQLYYHFPRKQHLLTHYEPFFYPLDKIAHWNRMYGKRGFYQFQCVVPLASAETAISHMLERIAASGQGSFLSVLKKLGDHKSPGMLSFPRSGITLALDFANRGESTRQLLGELDTITARNNGAVYPAKDATMSAASFKQYFPRWEQFCQYIDPHFSSSFWQRVTGD